MRRKLLKTVRNLSPKAMIIGILLGVILLSACGTKESVNQEAEVSEVTERVIKIAETTGEESSVEKSGNDEALSDGDGVSDDEASLEEEAANEDNVANEDNIANDEEVTIDGPGSGTIEYMGKLFSDTTKMFSFDALPLPEELEGLKNFPNLEKVDLSRFDVTDEEMATVQAALPGVEIVRTISLADLGNAFSKMTTRTDVKELDFSNLYIADMDALRTCLDQMTSLEQLVLCETGLTNEQMAPLRDEYPTVKVVWMIHMGIHRFRTDVIAFSTMAEEDDKEFVSSYNCEQFKYCTDLLALDLGHQKIHELDWLRYVPNLRVLILGDTNIEDITPIGELTELRYLEVFGCYWITDWSPLENCTKMEDLNICFDHRTEDYNYLNFMPNLKRFWAKKAYNPETIEEIKLILPPDCEFNYEGGEGSTDCGWRGVERFYAMRNCFLNNCLDPLFAD